MILPIDASKAFPVDVDTWFYDNHQIDQQEDWIKCWKPVILKSLDNAQKDSNHPYCNRTLSQSSPCIVWKRHESVYQMLNKLDSTIWVPHLTAYFSADVFSKSPCLPFLLWRLLTSLVMDVTRILKYYRLKIKLVVVGTSSHVLPMLCCHLTCDSLCELSLWIILPIL